MKGDNQSIYRCVMKTITKSIPHMSHLERLPPKEPKISEAEQEVMNPFRSSISVPRGGMYQKPKMDQFVMMIPREKREREIGRGER